jgi:type IV pilus assembly protein PilO
MAFNLKGMNLSSIDLKDPKTQTKILLALLGVAAAAAYLLFLFMPQVAADLGLIGKIFKTRSDVCEARSLIADMDTLKKKAADFESKIEHYEKKLPAEQEVPSLLENLSKMARNANTTIASITPVPASTVKGQRERGGQVYKEMPISITARSGYHELGRFIDHLENGDRFIKVVNISIKANATTPRKHDVGLIVYTYVLPAE